MRILYIDVDTLRSDHLGCYGYHRPTTPNIDRIAAEGIRFERCYVSDAPCLPSRIALLTGRFGFQTGVVGQGGTGAEFFPEGAERGFGSKISRGSFPARLRQAGLHTATISSFAERHAAYEWYAGFVEHQMVPKRGLENADEVTELTLNWLSRKGGDDDWFLHVHFWDPHTPYRVPESYGHPFSESPLPDWLTDEVRAQHYQGCGPHSARECVGFSPEYPYGAYPRQPRHIPDMDAVRSMFDGYDTGIHYMDAQVGRLLTALSELGVLDDLIIVVTSDHGENLGELNVYGDHHTADEQTCHVPMILRAPGTLSPTTNGGLYYQMDMAAAIVDLASGSVPPDWDGKSFLDGWKAGSEVGREALVLSQAAWTCQRAVRFDRYLCIRTYHDGYHDYPDVMLFDIQSDPHQQRNLASQRPLVVAEALTHLDAWYGQQLEKSSAGRDPLHGVIAEGGPAHVRGHLPDYLTRLQATGRSASAERLRKRHPRDV